jgi:hypothetical protein
MSEIISGVFCFRLLFVCNCLNFSSDTSPSRYEFTVTREFFRELGGLFHVVVAMKASDGGSLLRPKYIDKCLEIEDFLQVVLCVLVL